MSFLHFHIGSQIPSIQSIKSSIKEGAQFYTELSKLAPNLRLIDVGGGLELIMMVPVEVIAQQIIMSRNTPTMLLVLYNQFAKKKSVAHPDIVTESGRALVAHSSILIF